VISINICKDIYKDICKPAKQNIMKQIISFPHMANYSIPIKSYIQNILPKAEVLLPPPQSVRALDIGARHSPESVCLPFKYNLGNYIEALDMGANFLMTAGGGCRYGLYGEVHEQILRDLGYEFTFFNLLGDTNKTNVIQVYKNLKAHNPRLSARALAYYSLLAFRTIQFMDEVDVYIRRNIGLEKQKSDFDKTYKQFLNDIQNIKGFRALKKLKRVYTRRLLSIPLDESKDVIKVGLIGELYSLMEPFANLFLERELAKYNISLTRYTNLSYLLTKRRRHIQRYIDGSGGFVKYHLGADGTKSVEKSISMAKNNYAGIIHLKAFGCTPEINAIPSLINVSNQHKIPIMYLSFDTQTSKTGLKTRVEAFADMLQAKQLSASI